MRFDLHCHTTCSDGTLPPEKIIALAQQLQLEGLSITDHDTIAAYDQPLDFRIITGIEFSSSLEGVPIHILGYAFKPKDPHVLNLEARQTKRRQERNQKMIQKLQSLGFDVTLDDVLTLFNPQPKQVGRPHLAQILVEKGYVSTFKEAFSKYLREGKLCYVPSLTPTIEETIDTIHQANGFAILAHPHLIPKKSIYKKLLNFPFDGIEGYYAKMGHKNLPFIEEGKKRGWLVTGGSDFHGSIRPLNPLGCSFTPQETFEVMEKRYHDNL